MTACRIATWRMHHMWCIRLVRLQLLLRGTARSPGLIREGSVNDLAGRTIEVILDGQDHRGPGHARSASAPEDVDRSGGAVGAHAGRDGRVVPPPGASLGRCGAARS